MGQWSNEVFSRNLRRYLEGSGKTQRDLAEVVGVSTATFSDWINAKKYPRIDKIEMLADYFGILKSDLIEEKMTEEKEKDNDIISDVIIRMRMDEDFRLLVAAIYALDSEKIKGVSRLLDAFT